MRHREWKFEAIGTSWVIDIYTPTIFDEKKVYSLIQKRIDEFDKSYSRFRKDSFIWKVSEKKGRYYFPKDAVPLLRLYSNLYKISDKSFTPFIGSVLKDIGYDENYTLKANKVIKSPPSWSEVVEHMDGRSLKIKIPAIFDFGAAGKGYIIDLVGNILEKNNITMFCIDAGGDILFRSKDKSITVGLENPLNTKQVIGTVTIQNESICASAGNRRKWGEYHHIINPHTLKSPNHILGTWTKSKTTIIADAMSTALFFTKPKVLKKYFDFEYCVLYRDFSIEVSKGFTGKFFHKSESQQYA